MAHYSNLTAAGVFSETIWANATIVIGNTTTSTQSSLWGVNSNTANVVAFCMASILILLCCWAIQPSIPAEEHRRAFILRQRAIERYRRRREMKKPTPEQRMECIEKSLITKRVMECDAEGNLTLGDPAEDDLEQQQLQEPPTDDVRSINSIDAEDDASMCVICLAAFRVGDVVAWSKLNDDCLHVFHRECIVPWLQNPLHSDCPSCRSVILKVEDEEEDIATDSEDDKPEDDDENYHDGMGDHSERSNHSTSQIFVIMHGLISRARRASYSLIGQNIDTTMSFDDDDDDDDCGMEMGMMIPPPSPGLRRVVSMGDRSARAISLRRRSLRNNSEQDLTLTPSPQVPKPIRILDRNLAFPPFESSLESLKQPMKLRRVVSVDTGSNRRRRRPLATDLCASSSEDNSLPLESTLPDGPFLRVMRRASAASTPEGAYARIVNGDFIDSGERSLDQEDGLISQVPSLDGTQRSVSWSSDLVMTASQPPPSRRRRSASNQPNSVDEEDYEDFEEDVLSEEEDELGLVQTQSSISDRSAR